MSKPSIRCEGELRSSVPTSGSESLKLVQRNKFCPVKATEALFSPNLVATLAGKE
ncbi:hypothetical protein D3C86_953780 [compost metagenome]